MQSYILYFSRLEQREPLIALESQREGTLISASVVPIVESGQAVRGFMARPMPMVDNGLSVRMRETVCLQRGLGRR